MSELFNRNHTILVGGGISGMTALEAAECGTHVIQPAKLQELAGK